MISKAANSDVAQIKSLTDYWVEKKAVLPRSLDDIKGNLTDFFVWKNDGHVLGAVSLDIEDGKTAVIRTLCVSPKYQGKGIGTQLVHAALQEAKDKNVETIYAVTKNVGFFNKFGFSKNKTILSDGQEKAYMRIGASRLADMNFSSISLATSSENCSEGCLQK